MIGIVALPPALSLARRVTIRSSKVVFAVYMCFDHQSSEFSTPPLMTVCSYAVSPKTEVGPAIMTLLRVGSPRIAAFRAAAIGG